MQVIADKYELIRELGEGATGKVYLVKHRELGVQYALKLLNRVLSADTRFIERFKREAEVMERFTHPGSIRLRDFGKTSDGLYYMTMDYCNGQLLKDVIDNRGCVPPVQTLKIMSQVLDVMGSAHQTGVVHRDIKPDNIMLEATQDGRIVVKVLDFGIAKLKEQMDLESSVTMEGASIGTPRYMSPEQANGESALDHRVDIYAGGILMYELLAGKVPFKGDTVVQTLLMHLMKPPPPFDPALGVPQFIEAIVLRALQKNRDERYQSAEEFKLACDRALEKLQVENKNTSESFSSTALAMAKQLHDAPIREPGSVKKPKDLLAIEAKPAPAPIELKQVAEEPVESAQLVGSADESVVVESSTADDKEPTKILCLDDNEMILNILAFVLEKAGYSVITTTESSMAHHYLFHNNIRLLVSDVQMPGLPGTKICKMLKESVKNLKVVLFSNINERELEKLSNENRADAWISKNSKPNEWLARITEIVGPP